MSNIDYIIDLCFDISEQGKTPSVALIRSIAQHPLAIPEVIKGLQRWKSSPGTRPNTQSKQVRINPLTDPLTDPLTEQSLQQRVAQLENQVATIMQTLAKMSGEKKN